MKRSIFVVGTDTGVGKTVICGLLGRYLSSKGYNTITQKWIESGAKNFSADVNMHLRLMKKRRKDIQQYLAHVSPYVFKLPVAAHLAARLEGKVVNARRIKARFKILSKIFDFVIVEGMGGALVPFNEKELVIDIAADLHLPVLIVAANKLGAINHTVLTVEAIEKRKMPILGIVYNESDNKTEKIILKDNPKIIKRLTGKKTLGVLPRKGNADLLYSGFIQIGKNILSELKGSR